jgi:sugar lactone lactonase YvrE
MVIKKPRAAGTTLSVAHTNSGSLEGRDMHDRKEDLELGELPRIAAVEISPLADRTGRTINLALPAGSEVVYVGAWGDGRRIGQRVPLLRTAVGEALAANQDERARRSQLEGSDERQLAARLDLVRARGYAIETDELDAGVAAVAAPVVDRSGRAIGAISCEGPIADLPRGALHELARPLIETTRIISQHFGGALRPTSKAARPAAPPSSSVGLLADTRNLIGECPLYDAANERLYWVDMYDPAVYRFDCRSGKLSSYLQDEMVTALALTREGMLIAAQSGLWLADPDTLRRIRYLGHPEAHIPGNRFNDGKCDGGGRFWVNTIDLEFGAGAGALYRREADGSFAMVETGLTLPNGLGWSPDNRTMYLVETRERAIYAYDFSYDTGQISNRRVLVSLPVDASGAPDGMAVDGVGNIWVALFDGWRVSQFSPEGRLLREVVLPVPRPTSCAIGGPDGQTLFVTSARIRVSERMLQEAPHSGAVFAIAV